MRIFMTCAAALFGVASASYAQIDTGVPGPTASPATAAQQADADRWNWTFGGFNEDPWFEAESVRRQLELDEQQFNQLRDRYGRSWERYDESLTRLPRSWTEEQRASRRQELSREFNDEFSRSRAEVLTDRAKQQRFDQLWLQYQGLNAFNDPSVYERLNLTPAQRRGLAQMQRAWQNQFEQINPSGNRAAQGENPADLAQQWRDFQQRTDQSVDQLLTPQQRRSWEELRGERFHFPPESYFPGDNGVNAAGRASPAGTAGSAAPAGTAGEAGTARSIEGSSPREN